MSSSAKKGTALVTGASSGVGAAYADRLAKAGYDLILVARNEDRLASLAKRLVADTGRSVETVIADLAEADDLARVEATLKTNPAITLLVNNAGVGATAPLLQSDVKRMEDMITLNVSVLMRLVYAAVPAFVSRGGGTIINISSSVALSPEQLNGVYAGTKAFVLAFSQSIHHELGAKGIRVQAGLPGATATDFWHKAGIPIEHLPKSIVMPVGDMVDAALAGLEQGELVTIPSLPNKAEWDAFEHARAALWPNLSLSVPAPRYGLTPAR
jgi:short-subunit dehydrogenase